MKLPLLSYKKIRNTNTEFLSIDLPTDLLDLKLWLDAADETTIIESGGFVSEWSDKSGQVNDALQLTGANQPETGLHTINALNVLSFDGIIQYLSYDGLFLIGTDYTIFVVERRTSDKDLSYFLGGTSISGVNVNLHLGYKTDILINHAQFANDYDATVSAFTTPISRIHTFTFNSAVGKKYHQSNVELGSRTDSAGKTGLGSYSGARIGLFRSADFYQGHIGEIIIYDRALTDSERTQVNVYAVNKWAIDSNFPLAFSADFSVDFV